MDATARLLEDICNAPDDDAPRLVWADAVGGERGELVVIQCRLAREDLPPREAIALRRRQRDLLARHGAAWSGLAGRARRVSFRRGFVDAAMLTADTVVSADPIWVAPLLAALSVAGSDEQLAAIVTRARDLPGLHLAADDRIDVARWGVRDGLRAFGVAGELDERGLLALLPIVRSVERLWIDPEVPADVLVRVLEAGTALHALDLRTSSPGALGRIAPRLPATVTELRFGDVQDGELAALANAPVGRTLERLAISRGTLVHDLRLFDRFPRLCALALHGLVDFGAASVRPAALRTFASLRLPRLRELAITAPLDEQSTLRVAEAFGAQLELLDLRNNHHAVRHVNELKRRVAGELLVEHPFGQIPEQGLLRVGPTHQMPWWDHVVLP